MTEPVEVTAEIVEEETALVAVKFEPAAISVDWDGITAKIKAMLEPYDGVTAESLAEVDNKECKALRADLNRISKELNDARKAAKKQYESPLKAFEARCKELDQLILEPCAVIDGVIKSREEQERAEKFAELEAHYIEFCEDNGFSLLLKKVKFERILKKEWLNKSFHIKKAFDEIDNAVAEIRADFDMLMLCQLFDRDGAIIEFFNTLSKKAAVDYDKRREADQKQVNAIIEEREQVQQYRENEPTPVEAQQEPVKVWQIWLDEGAFLTCTRTQIMQIREACESMGIILHGKPISKEVKND